MYSKGYPCGSTLEECFDRFRITPERGERIRAALIGEGYTEKGICYGAGKAENKLISFIGDTRFDGIFKNEVRKYAMKKDDPRWRRC